MEIFIFALICGLTLWIALLQQRNKVGDQRQLRADAIIERCRMTIHNLEYLTPAERLLVLNGIEAYQEDVK